MILVTGGAGYVGCVTVQELLRQGKSVRVLDRMLFGSHGLEAARDKLELVEADIRRPDPSVFDGVSAVVHLAALSNDPMAEFDPRANHAINAVATDRLARAARKAGVARFVYASSCSLYDRGLGADDAVRDERCPVDPRMPYSVAKYEGEQAVMGLRDERFSPVTLRKGTVYGFSPRMRYDLVVNTFVKDALDKGRLTVFAGGDMWRPLVDVMDVARAYAMLVEADEDAVGGEVFCLVYRNYRVLDLAHEVREALKSFREVDIDVRPADRPVRSYRVSGDKLDRALGFRPTVSVRDSVLDMVQRITKHGMTDFMNPRYYNIEWFKIISETESRLARVGPVF